MYISYVSIINLQAVSDALTGFKLYINYILPLLIDRTFQLQGQPDKINDYTEHKISIRTFDYYNCQVCNRSCQLFQNVLFKVSFAYINPCMPGPQYRDRDLGK